MNSLQHKNTYFWHFAMLKEGRKIVLRRQPYHTKIGGFSRDLIYLIQKLNDLDVRMIEEGG